nr:MAG TPA: hypothetical protein [Caudoviricetes sp.]
MCIAVRAFPLFYIYYNLITKNFQILKYKKCAQGKLDA